MHAMQRVFFKNGTSDSWPTLRGNLIIIFFKIKSRLYVEERHIFTDLERTEYYQKLCSWNSKSTKTKIQNYARNYTRYMPLKSHFLWFTWAKWYSVCLQSRWLWVGIPSQSFKFHSSHLFWENFLDIQATIECRFTLKEVFDMIRTCS